MHPWLALRGYEYVICIYYLGIRIRYSYTFHRCNIRSYVRKNATGNSKVFFDSSTKIDIRCIITIKIYHIHNIILWHFTVPSDYQIRCCASYVIQKRSKSFSFGICHEHLLSIVMASLWSASLYSYVYFEKVINPYFICTYFKSDISHH